MNRKTNLKVQELSISKIFCSDYVFSIPFYQRPYSWEEEHVRELSDDLLSAMEEQEGGFYFLGSIVLIKEEGKPEAQIIDGQQRLTSLTILLCVLRDLIQDEGSKKEINERIKQEAKNLQGIPERLIFELRRQDQAFFKEYIQNNNATSSLPPLRGLNEVEERIVKNARYFYMLLKKEAQEVLLKFATFISIKCFLVVISVPNEDAALRIFSVLNARGLDLSHADIIKADLLQRISTVNPNKLEEEARKWEEWESDLGRQEFVNLLTHISYLLGRDSSQRGSFSKDFKKIMNFFHDEEILSFMDKILIPYAEAYQKLKDYKILKNEFPKGLEKKILSISHIFELIPNDSFAIVVIYFIRKYNDLRRKHITIDLEELSEYFNKIELLYFYFKLIPQRSTNSATDRFIKSLNIRDENKLFNEKINLNKKELEELFNALDREIYKGSNRNKIVNLSLLKLNSLLIDENLTIHNKTTIEHILPQKPDKNSQWCQNFTEEEREKWTNRLANLVLLSGNRNSKAQNFDFENKKEKYFFDKERSTGLALTNELRDIAEWTPRILEERQEKMIRLLAREWNIESAFDEWLNKKNNYHFSL